MAGSWLCVCVEFQKRGLPHTNMLIILQSGKKNTSANHYDKYVRIEIPNKHTDPAFHEVVVKHMLHGLEDAYPIYKRKNDGNKVKFNHIYVMFIYQPCNYNDIKFPFSLTFKITVVSMKFHF